MCVLSADLLEKPPWFLYIKIENFYSPSFTYVQCVQYCAFRRFIAALQNSELIGGGCGGGGGRGAGGGCGGGAGVGGQVVGVEGGGG